MPIIAKGTEGYIFSGYRKALHLGEWKVASIDGLFVSPVQEGQPPPIIPFDISAVVLDFDDFLVLHGNQFEVQLYAIEGKWCWSLEEFNFDPKNRNLLLKVKGVPHVKK